MDSPQAPASVEGTINSGVQLSITACLRCREQKLKCGRERPICARCERLNTRCSYPEPPNRRGPRTRRGNRLTNRTTERSRDYTRPRRAPIQYHEREPVSQNDSIIESRRFSLSSQNPRSSFGPDGSHEETSSHGNSRGVDDDASAVLAAGTPVLSDSYPTQLRTMSSITTEPMHISDQPPLPPTALCLSLLEIYFTRVYNAHLLFHKPTLFQQYLEGSLHGALLRALLALSTLFLRSDLSHADCGVPDDHAELKILSMYHSSGLPWARTALKDATVLAVDNPSLMIIQALECLQLYWFGIGQPSRGNLCLALAYRACNILGYSKKVQNINDSDLSLESELGRRCFWACWTSTCIVMEPEAYVKASWQEISMVPLPAFISNTASGYFIALGDRMDEEWNSKGPIHMQGLDKSPEAAAIFMKMVGIWSKVQLLCKNRTMSAVAQNFETGEKLSQMATSLFNDATSHRNSEPENYESPEDKAFLLVHDALYHQCQITIYSMIVPVFSGMPTDPAINLDKQKKGAELVTKHADLFRRLLHPFFCGQRHVSFLPPLVGYGAFVVAIVLLTLEISCKSRSGSGIPPESSKTGCRLNSVISLLTLLDELRIYWRALQTPWETLNTALQAHFSEHLEQPSSTHSRIGKPSTSFTSENVPETPTHNQNMNRSDYQLGNSSGATRSADILQGQGDSLLSSGIDNGIGGSSEFEMSDTLMSQADLLPDYDWYSLSFAEAGVGEFSGLEPSTLFQQGWHTFS